jgi:iron complex transport system substrate-binding protein
MKPLQREFIRRLFPILLILCLFLGCSGERPASKTAATGPEWSSLNIQRQVPLRHATEFSLTEYDRGYTLLDIPTSGRFLIIPEGEGLPRGLEEDIVPLFAPLDRIYLAATSSMDFFRALDSVSAVRLSGTDVNGWYIQEAREALQNGGMVFAGKYSAPDYELIFAEKCDLAVESTMIYHSPEVKEQLEKLGVPVLVERSSYEEDPLGRMEWIKVYGALLGKLPLAESLFDAEVQAVEPLLDQPETGKTVAFFYITTTGTVNVRKSSDYVPRMIHLAGGAYVFDRLDSGSALSTVNMTMESFYDGAKDADLLIYNSTIDGELFTLDELLQKSAFLKDFKAVQTGNVWCTGKNLFQEPMGLGKLILDMHRVLTDEDAPAELTYLHRLSARGE